MQILQEPPEKSIPLEKRESPASRQGNALDIKTNSLAPPAQVSNLNPTYSASVRDAPSKQASEQAEQDHLGFMKQVEAERASQPLYEQVYLERRLESMKQLEQFEQSRSKYFLKHAEVLESVESGLMFKIRQASEFFNESIGYFGGMVQVYKHFCQNLTKIRAFDRLRAESPRVVWYSSMENGMSKILDVKDKCASETHDLQKWMEGALLSRLKESLEKFMQTIGSFGNEIDRARVHAADNNRACFKMLENMRKLMQERSRFDMMSQQLELNELYVKFQQSVIQWGKLVSLFWTTAQRNEARLLSTFKHTILELIAELQRVYQPTPQLEDVKRYWQDVQLDHQPEFTYLWKNVVKAEQTQFIRRSLNRDVAGFEDVEAFFRLEHASRVVGSSEPITSLLTTKKFNAMVAANKSLKDWAACSVYLTVDGWLVFQMENDRTVRNHMQMSRLHGQHTAEQLVCVVERVKGIIFDSSNREWLHFNRVDEAEEFLFLTEPNLERKKAYLE